VGCLRSRQLFKHCRPVLLLQCLQELIVLAGRAIVSVSTSCSRDGLKTYFSNVLVSSRSQQSVGRSRSRLGLKAKHLCLVSVSGHNISFTSGHLNKFSSFFHFSYKTNERYLLFIHSLVFTCFRFDKKFQFAFYTK